MQQKNTNTSPFVSTVLFDVINMGEVGSVCNFLMFIPDNGIQAMLKSQDESKKDFAKNLVYIYLVYHILKWFCYNVYS